MTGFQLDSRLAGDCHVVGDLALCRVLLMNDVRYPWLILVPRVADITEVYQLSLYDQKQLWAEVTAMGQAIMQDMSADKLNIAALGNMVPQLHVHVIARSHSDAAWPGPVWGVGEPQPYAEDELNETLNRTRILIADMAGV